MMLVLSREIDEEIIIGDNIVIKVIDIEKFRGKGGRVRLGIEAPREISVHRREVADQIAAANQIAAAKQTAEHIAEEESGVDKLKPRIKGNR